MEKRGKKAKQKVEFRNNLWCFKISLNDNKGKSQLTHRLDRDYYAFQQSVKYFPRAALAHSPAARFRPIEVYFDYYAEE